MNKQKRNLSAVSVVFNVYGRRLPYAYFCFFLNINSSYTYIALLVEIISG
jgi:hypothetical protein